MSGVELFFFLFSFFFGSQCSSPYQSQSRPFIQQNYPSQAPRTNEIDEEYLVTLDSDTFQDYIHQIRKQRSLTRNEEQIVKRLVKKIKNRESARKSRQAKKEISQELDEQVLKLTEQTQNMKLVCIPSWLWFEIWFSSACSLLGIVRSVRHEPADQERN